MTLKKKEKPRFEDSKKMKDRLEELNETLENLQKEKEELFGKLQRVSADYANFQKRAPKQIADTISYEKEKIIKSLLPALDNFEHTLQNAHSVEDTEVFIKGVQIIHDQMIDILKSHGVERIDAPGEIFDPTMHEAMMQKTDPEQEDNIVLEEFQKGYKLNGRVIRPSKVIVNKLISEQPAHQKTDPEETIADEGEANPQEEQ